MHQFRIHPLRNVPVYVLAMAVTIAGSATVTADGPLKPGIGRHGAHLAHPNNGPLLYSPSTSSYYYKNGHVVQHYPPSTLKYSPSTSSFYTAPHVNTLRPTPIIVHTNKYSFYTPPRIAVTYPAGYSYIPSLPSTNVYQPVEPQNPYLWTNPAKGLPSASPSISTTPPYYSPLFFRD